jgi:hypothetical protein
MKVVQIGILVALIAVAGLLYKVSRQQDSAAKVESPVAATEVPPAEAAVPAPAPPVESGAPATAERRPSPSPAPRAARKKAAALPPLEVASSVPPSPAPQPVAQPAQEPPALAPAPAPVPLTPPSGTPTAPRQPQRVTVPAGTLLTVRLTESLSSDKNTPGEAFSATLDQPLIIDGFVLAERGSRLEGRVLESEKAGRVKGLSSLAIHLTSLRTSDGQTVAIQTERFVKEGVTSKADDAKKVGAGAAIGAAIGAIAGGGKGAAIGAGVGGAAGGGTVLATRGKPATLPSETRISFKLQEPVTVTEKIR